MPFPVSCTPSLNTRPPETRSGARVSEHTGSSDATPGPPESLSNAGGKIKTIYVHRVCSFKLNWLTKSGRINSNHHNSFSFIIISLILIFSHNIQHLYHDHHCFLTSSEVPSSGWLLETALTLISCAPGSCALNNNRPFLRNHVKER